MRDHNWDDEGYCKNCRQGPWDGLPNGLLESCNARKMRSSDEPSEVVSLPIEEARWLDEILGLLGMHEEGDPVERVRELLDKEIVSFRSSLKSETGTEVTTTDARIIPEGSPAIVPPDQPVAQKAAAWRVDQSYLDLAKAHADDLYDRGGMGNQLVANAIWHMHDFCSARPVDTPDQQKQKDPQ